MSFALTATLALAVSGMSTAVAATPVEGAGLVAASNQDSVEQLLRDAIEGAPATQVDVSDEAASSSQSEGGGDADGATDSEGLGQSGEAPALRAPAVVPLSEPVPFAGGALRCEPGYIYGIGISGQLQEIAPGGAKTNIGTAAANVSSFNGLGIGTGGTEVYGYERSRHSSDTSTLTKATFWTFDTSSQTWSSTGVTFDTYNDGLRASLVAGAVDLLTGKYYFGGFTDGFKLFEYDPDETGPNKVKFKGTVQAGGNDGNGDIAFDNQGNLHILRNVA